MSIKEAAGADLLAGVDIGAVLASKGPIVKAVLLRHARHDGKDVKPHPAYANADEIHQRQVLSELIEEIELDTTPSKSAAAKILGGPVTFVGQFPTEGTVLMARKEIPEDAELEEQSIGKLRKLCNEFSIDTTGFVEKTELVNALSKAQLPLNPHRLQPPLDGIRVFGDILVLKVAETEEELDKDDDDDEEDDEEDEQADAAKLQVPSNDEFFLDYTRDEYIHFASRTDVVAPEFEEDDDEENDEDENSDDDEEDFELGEDDDLDDEERSAMLNMLLSQVIKKFRDEHGRGPNTKELLELRGEVAAVLGVEVATFDQITGGAKHAADDDQEIMQSPKKVKFSNETGEGDAVEESEDSKPLAKEDSTDGKAEENKGS